MNYKEQAENLLKKYYGDHAKFKQGQLEAILSVLEQKRILVVQKTGWGKSLVYFFSTKILREQGYGPTILISPLISLIRNQAENAKALDLEICSINSENNNEWQNVYEKLQNNQCDILTITPEKLGNREIIDKILSSIQSSIPLFVIDEAHCISEWGHDFRPDFLRINKFIETLPKDVSILATTATANNRVIEDIHSQLGKDTEIQRGPLIRESLNIQVINLAEQEDRLAWLVENIRKIEGSGIVYCLTKRDCDIVCEWLNINGISAEKYYSSSSINRLEVENDFYNNKFKVIVATVALGMGYDKPDIKFVIHYQRPGSLLAYYQQIGRAGRQLDEAFAILLTGKEDDEIQNYFINTAFPNIQEMQKVLNIIENVSEIKESEILEKVNLRKNKVEQCLKFLEISNIITKDKAFYSRTPNEWKCDIEGKNKITNDRNKELMEIKEYTQIKSCYMEFISKCLNDLYIKKCGKCANCASPKFSETVTDISLKKRAQEYLKQQFIVIEPRSKYPNNKNIPSNLRNEVGYALCSYGDSGWGALIKRGKYTDEYFDDTLVDASFQLLCKQKFEQPFDIVAYVPSLNRPHLVKEFAERLALKFNIPCEDIIIKTKQTLPQKEMENSAQQYNNICDCFVFNNSIDIQNKCILLVDDMFDSKWTLTICGIILKEAGAKYIYPYALASTAGKD